MAILLLLLPLLAALQYHWVGQLSDGERQRMQEGLRSAALRFSQDFNHEITRAGVSLMPSPNLPNEEKLTALAEGYERWHETASFPTLIKAIYVTRPDESGQLNLVQLKSEVRQFEVSDWPEEMKPLRQRIEQHLTAMRHPPEGPPDPQANPDRGRRPPPLQLLNGEIPAMTLPLVEFQRMQDQRDNREYLRPMPWGYAIITLNMHCIQQEILPMLTQRHFSEGGQLSYELVITSQADRRQIVYQTAGAAGAAGVAGAAVAPGAGQTDLQASVPKEDTSIGLFGFNFDEIRALMMDRAQRTEQGPTGIPLERNGDTRRMRGAGGQFPFPPGPGGGRMRFGPGDQRELWELHLRHRAGSLEAAVSRNRWRNLFISSSILVVLAASIAMLVISAQRARSLAQQQMDFVAGVSHELRTPIAVIDAAGYNIARGVMKNEEQIKKYGLLIRKETNRLKEIVEQVLEFSGVQSGRQKYDLLPTNISQVIEEVLASSQPLLDEGGFQVEKDIAPDLPIVMADSQAISRAIQNLLNNAMKYSHESRWIGLKAEILNLHQGQSNQGLQIRITVSDHGLGISPEEQPHIFEPFYRGREARAAQIRGSGLGLSLVKNIVEAHGGSISVQSNPGEGSVFTMSLPATAPVGDQIPTANHRQTPEALQPGIES